MDGSIDNITISPKDNMSALLAPGLHCPDHNHMIDDGFEPSERGALSYAWSLFDDIEFGHDMSAVTHVPVSSLAVSNADSKRKFSNKGSDDGQEQDSKRVRPDDNNDTASDPDIASAVHFRGELANPEALRIREILESRVREVLLQHLTKYDDAGITLQLVPVTSNDRYHPSQYFRLITQALDGGSFTDVRNHIDRFFSADCSFRCVSIPVRVFLS
jgi:hypothetical protein